MVYRPQGIVKALEQIQKHKAPFWFNNNWPDGVVASDVNGTGYVTFLGDHIDLDTGELANSWAAIMKMAHGLGGEPSWDKKRYFGVFIPYITHVTDLRIHIVSGYITHEWDEELVIPEYNFERHIGFKIIDNVLYGTVGNGENEEAVSLGTVEAGPSYMLECVLTPGVECSFYVNGVYRNYIGPASLPTGDLDAEFLLYAGIFNLVNEWRVFSISEVHVLQVE